MSAGRRRLLGPVLATLLATTGLCHAMWASMTDAELRQQSALIVEGEWVGEGPTPGRSDAARVGRIVVSKVWQGRLAAPEVRIARPPAGAPISSTDLTFRPGDRGLWFLKPANQPGATDLYQVDHPQRFLRDSPENAAALKSWRERLAR